MCGIVGVCLPADGTIDRDRLEAMTRAVSHRGPDGSGTWISGCGRAGLGHARLSILDLSPAGAQPMLSRSGRFALTFNGEIYNFIELRRELEGRGATFRGHSDTEVVLAAFEEWGVARSLPRLRGMFAVGVWDCLEESLTIARDRLGIKPLYHAATPRGLLFASELRPLAVWLGSVPPVSRQGLTEYLRLGYVPCPLSILEGVHKLPPGHFAIFRKGELSRPEAYWDLGQVARSGRQDRFASENEALSCLEAGLASSVASHMIADVPLGAMLSGGIDSSLVVSLMQSRMSRPVKTFSIGFHERGYNEAEHAAAVARHLGTDHTELYVTDEDARSVIPMLPDIYDEPFADQSQIPTFLVSRLARGQVTVALSGDGGDELFAGYNRYVFVERFWRRLRAIPLPVRRVVAGALTGLSPGGWDQVFRALAPILPRGLSPALPGLKMHKVASILPADSLSTLHARLVAQWASPGVILGHGWREDVVPWQGRLVSDEELTLAEQQMLWDAQTYLCDDILTKVDRASMRVGLEARVPLLDHEVVELAWRVPMSMKLRQGVSKWALRQVLYRHVPRELVDRPKMGFSVPVDAWLRNGVRPWAEHCLEPGRLEAEGYFSAPAVRRAWEAHLRGGVDLGGALWTVLMFQAWLERSRSWV